MHFVNLLQATNKVSLLHSSSSCNFSISHSLHRITLPIIPLSCITPTPHTITQIEMNPRSDCCTTSLQMEGRIRPRDVTSGFMSGIQRKLSVVEPGAQKSLGSHLLAHRCSKAALIPHCCDSLHYPTASDSKRTLPHFEWERSMGCTNERVQVQSPYLTPFHTHALRR